MAHEPLLGTTTTLVIRRFGSPGAFLSLDAEDLAPHAPTILLPGAQIPDDAKEGDAIEVFVHLDSEDRPIATTAVPMLELGEVAFLEVKDVTSFGAFVDWGLPKELLVPLGEQTRELFVGDRHPIGLLVDDTGRLAGTMRVSEMLREAGEFVRDEWVDGEAWRDDPELGLFVVVERRFVGLLPRSEPHRLARGEAARFRIGSVHPDGKIELSLRGHAHEELEGDARNVLAVLASGSATNVGDHSTPEELRALFGLSKKAFKRAVGRLLKESAVTIDRDGFVRVRR